MLSVYKCCPLFDSWFVHVVVKVKKHNLIPVMPAQYTVQIC